MSTSTSVALSTDDKRVQNHITISYGTEDSKAVGKLSMTT